MGREHPLRNLEVPTWQSPMMYGAVYGGGHNGQHKRAISCAWLYLSGQLGPRELSLRVYHNWELKVH
eukprot:8673685-Ditylum_brightwellii.AAC.1